MGSQMNERAAFFHAQAQVALNIASPRKLIFLKTAVKRRKFLPGRSIAALVTIRCHRLNEEVGRDKQL